MPSPCRQPLLIQRQAVDKRCAHAIVLAVCNILAICAQNRFRMA
jgi:hypothetical protein